MGMLRAAAVVWLLLSSGLAYAHDGDPRLLVRDRNTPAELPRYETKKAWLSRAENLRRQILVSAGLWPMPPRSPVKAEVFGRITRAGYTVEKVYFASHPGFFVTGNLYRPTKPGRHPAVLSPHGHWQYGRLEDGAMASVPGRAINLARQGHVVFTYDMIGYNDSRQLSHRDWPGAPLWSISIGGLQLWNSLRAADFVAGLPDVDPARLAATGASGGGTQTFMLTAVEPRIAASAPVNMVSASMQGGCICENMPSLRVGTSNVEIAALAAPRPLLLVSTTGDWTKDTPTVVVPWLAGIYRLLGAKEPVASVQMDAPHNYNKDSREAVYAFFGRTLLGDANARQFKESAFKAEPAPDLLVFYGRQPPADAVDPERLTANLIEASRRQLAGYQLDTAAGIAALRASLGSGYANVVQAMMPAPAEVTATGEEAVVLEWRKQRLPARLLKRRTDRVTVVVRGAEPLHRALADAGQSVVAIDGFPGVAKPGDFHDTYNHTDTVNRVQDVLTALAYAKKLGARETNLVGVGQGGLWVLLARAFAPGLHRVVADAARFESDSDAAYQAMLPVPGIRKIGGFVTAAALAGPGSLAIHDTGGGFAVGELQRLYRGFRAPLTTDTAAWNDARIVGFVAQGR